MSCRRPALATFVTLSLLVPARAWAQLDCVVPTRERTVTGPVASRSLAPFRTLVAAIETIVKSNDAFVQGARPVRVRTTIDYGDGSPRSAIVNTVAYNREAWVPGRCDVIPQADRGGGLADGAVHVTVNDAGSFLGPGEDDGVLRTFQEPALTGDVAGFPEYGGMYVLLSRDRRVPWVPVTVAEALDREERRLARERADWERDKQRPWLSAAKVQESYALLLKIDAAAAEKQRAALMTAVENEKATRPKFEAEQDARLAGKHDQLQTYRRGMTPAQLQAQASIGHFPDGRVRVDDPAGRKLVKLDPALAGLAPDAIHFLRVFVGGVPTDPVPGRWPWRERFKAAVDLTALHALIR